MIASTNQGPAHMAAGPGQAPAIRAEAPARIDPRHSDGATGAFTVLAQRHTQRHAQRSTGTSARPERTQGERPAFASAPGPRQPIVCLLGPTASGKTAAALALASAHGTHDDGPPLEIISIDSALLYRGMDIGTAKPGAAERARVPHHLIDIRDPAESYSAAEFRADALRLIDAIQARGHRVLLAGGTLLYYKALVEGLNDLPEADPTVRAALDAQAATRGWPALHARLAEVDPHTAARLAPHDAQRIQRALEIWQLTGKPMSVLLAAPRVTGDTPSYRFVPITLEPSARDILHERIAARFDAMLAAGFIDEVARLKARGDLHERLPSLRCVGYRQAWDYLSGKIDQRTLRERAIAATRQLCKRQLTWLRAIPARIVIDCCAPDAVERVVRRADQVWRETRANAS